MSETQPPKKKWERPVSSSNVDSSLLEKLAQIVASKDDHQPLIAFIESGSLPRILTNWSYFASVNDQSHFIDLSSKLSQVTLRINAVSGISDDLLSSEPNTEDDSKSLSPQALASQLALVNLKPQILEFYKSILNDYIKVVYRALNNYKPSLTNPTLRVLTNLISYDASLALEFLNTFDLTLTVLPKLLVPGKSDPQKKPSTKEQYLPIRANFIRFWVALNSKVPNHHRQDLLVTNYKIMNNWWKFMYESDTLETIKLVLEFIDQKILREPNFRRATKCKILNENFMYKAQSLFNRISSDSEDPFTKFYLEFMDNIATDSKIGLVFPTEKLWQKSTSSSQSGVEVTLNNKSFRIHNKLIYTLLTTLKPWENNTQLQFTLRILQTSPELVPPYMNWLIQHGGGYHDPSLTSWWVGHTLFLSHVIQLPVPQSIVQQAANDSSFVSQETNYDSRVIADNISLAPLSKSALTKGLETNKPIITQFALQLIAFTLQKLQEVLSAGFITNKQELIELVFYNIPDLSAILAVYNKNTDSKLIKLTSIKIINDYETIYPKNTSASAQVTKISTNGINEVIQSNLENCSGYDLTLLDYFLSIQSTQDQGQELKWWNKPGNGEGNSFFTCLVKLASSAAHSSSSSESPFNEALVWKLSNILTTLTETKSLFNKNLILTPITALIYASRNFTNNPRIWSFLDEVIARSVRTPYKYLDIAHASFGDLSLFVLVVIEQFKFLVEKADDSEQQEVVQWFLQLLKYLVIIGEAKFDLQRALGVYLPEEFPHFGSIVNFLGALDFNQTVKQDDNSLANYMVNVSNSDLVAQLNQVSRRTIITKFDFEAVLLRLKRVVNDQSNVNFEELIIDLVSKLGNFLLATVSSDSHLCQFITSKKFWSELEVTFFFDKDEIENRNKNKVFAGSLLNEVLQQLPINFVGEPSYLNERIFENIRSLDDWSTNLQLFFTQFWWMLSNDQIQSIGQFLLSNDIFEIKLVETSLQRKIPISHHQFDKVLRWTIDKEQSTSVNYSWESERRQVLSQMVESNLVKFKPETFFERVEKILETPEQHYLLKSFLVSSTTSENNLIKFLLEKSSQIEDDSLLCLIGYSLVSSIKVADSIIVNDEVEAFLKRVNDIAIRLLISGRIGTLSIEWNQVLTFLSHGLQYIRDEQSDSVISEIFKHVQNVGFKYSATLEFATFIKNYIENIHGSDFNAEIASWVHKSMLYITKKFAESSELSSNFDSFLKGISQIVQYLPSLSSSIWKLTPLSIINTQLEVILSHAKWVKNYNYLKYVNLLILTSSRNTIQFEKVLQIFINNASNELNSLPIVDNSGSRFYSALIIYNLFHFDPTKNSTIGLLEKIVVLYLGSIRSEDLLLKSVLIDIESKISKSWVHLVSTWEFSEELTNNEVDNMGEGENRLIEKERSNLKVCLSRKFVNNTIRSGLNGLSNLTVLPQIRGGSLDETLTNIDKFYSTNEVLIDQTYINTIYDSEFVLMLTIHNEEFVKIEKDEEGGNKVLLDLKNLIESNLLQLIVVSLSSPLEKIRNVSIVLLQGILRSIESIENFKDKNIFKVYISNILNTFRDTSGAKTELPGLIWYFYSALVPILANPGHFLYEKAFRFVLSNPNISNDIPLYKAIIHAQSNNESELENDESYYKQVVWLLEQFIYASGTTKDVDLLKFRGIFEWALNLTNSPFVTLKIKLLILKLVYTIQNIDQGSDVLITRFGILTSLEQINESLGDNLLDEQLALNLKQVVLRFGIGEGSSKRIRDWTSDDLPNYVKRIHK